MFLGNGQHPAAAQGIVRAVSIGMAAGIQQGFGCGAGRFVVQLLPDGIGGDQLGHIQHGIRVTGKHTGAGSTVHAALAALRALAVVVAVDDGTVQFPADQVKLVAELGHLVSAVFIAGDDFIDRVQHNGQVAFLGSPADQAGSQLIHGDGGTAQVPDVDVGKVPGRQVQGFVYIFEAVQAAGAVQFQIDIKHLALRTGKAAKPGGALGKADAQFDQGKAFACFAGTSQKHFVALAQHSFNQGICQRRQAGPVIGKAFGIGQVVRAGFKPVFPFLPAGFASVGFQQVLLFAAAQDARHAG